MRRRVIGLLLSLAVGLPSVATAETVIGLMPDTLAEARNCAGPLHLEAVPAGDAWLLVGFQEGCLGVRQPLSGPLVGTRATLLVTRYYTDNPFTPTPTYSPQPVMLFLDFESGRWEDSFGNRGSIHPR